MYTTSKQFAGFLLAVASMCLLVTAASAAGKPEADLVDVKAAYILNFMKFTQWPATAFSSDDSPLVISCIGDAGFAADLERLLEGKRVDGRILKLRTITELDVGNEGFTRANLEQLKSELEGSHAVFMSNLIRLDARTLIQDALTTNVLSVGDNKRFAESGAMLALGMSNNRIVFYANPDAIRASEIRISSKVLRLAKLVSRR